MQFEIQRTDLAARIGRMQTGHGTVETPAYVPVIHPAKQTIPASRIKEMGFDIVITNAYITRNTYGHDEAIRRGIHDIIKYDGAIMTDSGGYQVLEYGKVGVTPPEMAEFERGIRTDFAIPLDKPTGFGMRRDSAEAYVRDTLKVSREALRASKSAGNSGGGADGGQTWIGPIQGGEHRDLVARSTKSLVRMGFEMLALGSPVEFMESYEYRLLAEMIATAKRSMPHGIPLHLFGAGHPLTIPLAVALGCDTFDSASYILYARQDRYMTGDGTRALDEIEYFPCCCAVCSRYEPGELRLMPREQKINNIAVHNLYAIKLEVDRTKQAIAEGRLWEYVMKKSRAHPRLYEAVAHLMAPPSSSLPLSSSSSTSTSTSTSASPASAPSPDISGMFRAGTPQYKQKAAFLYGAEDQHRPEVAAYHDIVRKFRTKKSVVTITPESHTKPGYMSREYRELYKRSNRDDDVQFCQYSPILGIIPIEISDIYPAAHHEQARVRVDPAACTEFAKTWDAFFENNGFAEVWYDKNDAFLGHFAKRLKGVKKRSLKGAAATATAAARRTDAAPRHHHRPSKIKKKEKERL